MIKQYYDHRCKKCPLCAHYRPEGPRPDSRVDPKEIWPEACGLYGYSFSLGRYEEDADDCQGFETPQQYKLRLAMQEAKKKSRKQE